MLGFADETMAIFINVGRKEGGHKACFDKKESSRNPLTKDSASGTYRRKKGKE
jgi:hypothetical protein